MTKGGVNITIRTDREKGMKWTPQWSAVKLVALLMATLMLPATVRAQSSLRSFRVNGESHQFKVELDAIGVRVEKVGKTLEITTAAQGKGWTECTSLQVGASAPPKASLTYKGMLREDEKFARFGVKVNNNNCQPAELMTIAVKLDEELDNVTAAGLIVTSFEDGRTFLLTPDARGRAGGPWTKISPNPFDPMRGHLLRLQEGTNPLAALAPKPGTPEPILLPVDPSSDAEAGFDKWLGAQKSAEDKFRTKFTVNSVGDESATTRKTKLSLGFEGAQGDFPTKFSVTLGAQVEFKDQAVEEDVTKINATYEYYFEPWLGIFGYLDRLSNDFLSIDQRYESGIGARVAFTAKSKDVDEFCRGSSRLYHKHVKRPRDVAVTRNTRRMLEVYRSKIEREFLESQSAKKETRDEYCKYKRGIEKRNARFEAGLGLSFFADYEQPAALNLSTTPKVQPGADTPESVTGKFTPSSSQRNRLNFSPSIRFRPSERISILAEYSYKPATDEPREVLITSIEGRLENVREIRDARQDWYAEILIALTKIGGDGLDVDLKLTWEESHDALPPGATGEEARAALGLGELTAQEFAAAYSPIEGARANSTHTQFKVGLAIAIKP